MANQNLEKVRVVAQDFSDADVDHTDRFSVSTTLLQVKDWWAQKFEKDARNLYIFSADQRKLLDDSTSLDDLREAGRNLVNLLVQETALVGVRLWGSSFAALPARILLSHPPFHVFPFLRTLLRLTADRPLRLFSGDRLLDPDQPFLSQNIKAEEELTLDPGFQVNVQDAWDSEEGEIVACFASDPAVPILAAGEDLHAVVHANGRPMRSSDRVGKVFNDEEQQVVTVMRRRQFPVLRDGRIRECSLVPTCPVGSALHGAEPAFEGRVLPSAATMAECKLPQPALLACDVAKTIVRLSCGDQRLFRLHGPALIADLTREVAMLEENTNFYLAAGGKPLSLDTPIVQVPEAEVKRAEWISVQLQDGSVVEVFPRHRKSHAAFGDIHAAVSQHVGQEGIEFMCRGCRRRITAEWDGQQCVPADCCPQRSMKLRCVMPGYRDAVAQTKVVIQPDCAIDSRMWSNKYSYNRNSATGQYGDCVSKAIDVLMLGSTIEENKYEKVEFNIDMITREVEARNNLDHTPTFLFQSCAYLDLEGTTEIGYIQRDGSLIADKGQVSIVEMSSTIIKPVREVADIICPLNGNAMVMMRLNTVLLGIEVDASEARLVELPVDWETLYGPNVVAWIEGRWLKPSRKRLLIDCLSEKNEDCCLKWTTEVERVDVVSGQLVQVNRGQASKDEDEDSDYIYEDSDDEVDEREKELDVSFVHVLLKSGDRLPKWNLPDGYYPVVYTRQGYTLSVAEDGSVHVDEVGELGREWILSPSHSEFPKALAVACR